MAFSIGHFLAFAGAAFCLTLARSPVPIPGRMLQLLLLGAVTEVLQLYVPDRTGNLADWGIDSLGIAVGLGAALAYRRVKRAQPRPA